MTKVEEKGPSQFIQLQKPQLLIIEKIAFCELGTKNVCPVLTVYLIIHFYPLKDGRIQKLFSHAFRERIFPTSVLNGTRLLHLFLDIKRL